MEIEDKYIILVNPWHICPNNLNFNIIDVKSKYAANRQSEEKTYEAFKKFQKYAMEKGFNIEIESGYRSIEYQQKIYNNCINKKGIEYTKKYVATPGYSEHHTGLALDICLFQNDKYIIEHNLPEKFILFLQDNAHKFGFIIRYPKGKESITDYNYEPWHIRFVGEKIAQIIYENNLTLEEYNKLVLRR